MRPALGAAAARLRIDGATAEVLRSLDGAGVQSILLKGASNRQWLGITADNHGYGDCDLLLRPGDEAQATRILGALGFVPELDVQQMPLWWREHAVAWVRDEDRTAMDIHRTLPGIGVDDDRAWELLSRGTQQIVVGGYTARVLAIPARALHVALHAAHHGPDRRSLREVTLALERANGETWQTAAELATSLEALDGFLAGLRLVPTGLALVTRLGLEPNARGGHAFGGTKTRAPALTLERFLQARDAGTRLSMVRYKLIPPSTFMHRWSRLARHGPIGLVLAYAWRPLWVLSQVPAAVRSRRRP
jgi:hypothetical protein